MIVRKVIITENSNVSDRRLLAGHPNVPKYWPLPREHTLFEFSHPAFQLTRDSRFASSSWDEGTKELARAAVEEEQELLGPLYTTIENPSDALMLMIPSKTAMYEFTGRSKGRLQWPDVGFSPSWEAMKELRVAGRITGREAALDLIFGEWVSSFRDLGIQIGYSPMAVTGNYFNGTVTCSESSGDALMVLYLLATLTQTQTGVQSVGFFHHDDFQTPFFEVGGPRKTEQIMMA
jgi:hypothetical protein